MQIGKNANALNHHASCHCGQLIVQITGEITKSSICHCFSCQRRTGSVFGVQTRVDRHRVTVDGCRTQFKWTADSGGKIVFNFCPKCGSTVYWEIESLPDSLIVAIGAFADPLLVAPSYSVYEARKHTWVELPESVVEHWD